MRLLASQSVKVGLLPFGTEAGIAFEERAGQLNAVALIKQENGTLNIYPDGREELWALLSQQAVQDLIEQLRKDEAFLAFEKELASQGKQIDTAQSLGATTLEKGLLYLAVGESQGLTQRPIVSYYRIELSASDKGGYRVQGTPLDVCAVSKDDIKALGFPEGAIMHVIGVYEAGAEDKIELQIMQRSRDLCLLGLGALACFNFWPLELQAYEKEATIQEALSDQKVQQLKSQLEERGYRVDLDKAQAFQSFPQARHVLLPFLRSGSASSPEATLVWGQTEDEGERQMLVAKAIIRYENRWEILEPYQSPIILRMPLEGEREEILNFLYQDKEFQQINQRLRDLGYALDQRNIGVLFNESQEEFFIWLRWRIPQARTGAMRPLLIDDGYSSGGGGIDIAVFYDPRTGQVRFLIVPPELVQFLRCMWECIIQMGLSVDPAWLVMAAFICIGSCRLCIAAPHWLNPACWSCALCVARAIGVGAYCGRKCYREVFSN